MSTSIYIDNVRSIGLVHMKKVDGVGYKTTLIINQSGGDYTEIDLIGNRPKNMEIKTFENTVDAIDC